MRSAWPDMQQVSREEFEYSMVPWIGPEYAAWLRTSVRPHPSDEHRLVLVPDGIHRVFARRTPGHRAGEAELREMGYPRLPEEDELKEAYRAQRSAVLSGDAAALAEVHRRIDALQPRLEAARHALRTWQETSPEDLERRI